MSESAFMEPELFRCWCGEIGTAEQMFSDDDLDATCGGTGTLYCYCGGDFCICHFHGETECDGCEECSGGFADEYEDEP